MVNKVKQVQLVLEARRYYYNQQNYLIVFKFIDINRVKMEEVVHQVSMVRKVILAIQVWMDNLEIQDSLVDAEHQV